MDPQVDKIMLARKKDCPLLAKWAAIKGKHKAVANRSIFKGDVEPSIKAYDDAVLRYADWMEDQKALMGIITGVFNDYAKMKAEITKLSDDNSKSDDMIQAGKDIDQLAAYQKKPDSDPTDVFKSLDNWASVIDKAFALSNATLAAKKKANDTYAGLVKTARDNYKTLFDKVNSSLQKAYDDSDKAQEGIRSAITDYMDTADEIENADLKKQLQDFYKFAAR